MSSLAEVSDRRVATSYEFGTAMPRWLRLTVVAVAALIMCSCTSTPLVGGGRWGAGDASRAEVPLLRGQNPTASAEPARSRPLERLVQQLRAARSAERDPAAVETAVHRELPTHLTPVQMAQASAPLANCPTTACGCHGSGTGPVRGPNDEYLCDGGDYGVPAGVRNDYTIQGLEQEDTVAHYETVDGQTVITPSNKVCIYAPRFGAVRRVIDLHAAEQALMPIRTIQEMGLTRIDDREAIATRLAQTEPSIDRQRLPPSLLRDRAQAGELNDERRVALVVGALAPYANLKIVKAGVLIGEERIAIARASLAAIEWSGDQASQVVLDNLQAVAEVSVQSPGVIFEGNQPNNPRLRLLKLADKGWAQQGEEIEFTLRFDNIGDREIGNVTLADNLTTRLEYVEGSQKSTLDADFSVAANEAGSLVLRWEIRDPLDPGQGGVIQFRCRVR